MGSCRGDCCSNNCKTCGSAVCSYRDCDRGLATRNVYYDNFCSNCYWMKDRLDAVKEALLIYIPDKKNSQHVLDLISRLLSR